MRIDDLIKKKKIISVEEYLNLSGYTRGDFLKGKGSSKDVLFSGMLKWPDDEFPENWCGPFPLNYIYVRITKSNTTETELDIFTKNKTYQTRSKFNRLPSALISSGFDKAYWERPFIDSAGVIHPETICNYSEMTDEEIAKVESVETPEEKMFYEIQYAKSLVNCNVKHYETIEHPYRLYLCGNDDCSYSMFYNPKTCETRPTTDDSEFLSWDAWYTLKSTNWTIIEKNCHFTN